MWHMTKYGDPYSETAVNTHLEQRAAIYAAAPGEQLGVRCLAQGHLTVVLKVDRVLYIHSPNYISCWPETWTRNLSIMRPTI